MSGCQTCGGFGGHHDPIAHGTEPQRQCTWCGSPNVNPWTSWNVTGEWTCDDCTPPDLAEDDEW